MKWEERTLKKSVFCGSDVFFLFFSFCVFIFSYLCSLGASPAAKPPAKAAPVVEEVDEGALRAGVGEENVVAEDDAKTESESDEADENENENEDVVDEEEEPDSSVVDHRSSSREERQEDEEENEKVKRMESEKSESAETKGKGNKLLNRRKRSRKSSGDDSTRERETLSEEPENSDLHVGGKSEKERSEKSETEEKETKASSNAESAPSSAVASSFSRVFIDPLVSRNFVSGEVSVCWVYERILCFVRNEERQ